MQSQIEGIERRKILLHPPCKWRRPACLCIQNHGAYHGLNPDILSGIWEMLKYFTHETGVIDTIFLTKLVKVVGFGIKEYAVIKRMRG